MSKELGEIRVGSYGPQISGSLALFAVVEKGLMSLWSQPLTHKYNSGGTLMFLRINAPKRSGLQENRQKQTEPKRWSHKDTRKWNYTQYRRLRQYPTSWPVFKHKALRLSYCALSIKEREAFCSSVHEASWMDLEALLFTWLSHWAARFRDYSVIGI